ncbi:hypothetical protein MMG85_15880 [Pseudoxanthomonas sp. LH2527]|uniref:hypothetical protein n=1 Tax=Pseudoxanthomonas sp. LH2527 TaxID=2923249 RepID=UPI001F131FF5|nr:hypothetical protein [Pseudoxanthomonas sp. LH2527]MCH6485032.1 hypothetical protein [Pseudoxanthomonas sp. LH2527]
MLNAETMGLVDDLFGVQGISALVGLLVVVLVGLSKGWHVLVSERAKRREAFLQMWDPVRAAHDGFWLEGIIRYGYGVNLCAPLIRAFLATDHTSSLLYRMVISYRRFAFKEGSLVWTRQHRNHDVGLALEFLFGVLAYCLFMVFGLKLVLGSVGIQTVVVGLVLSGMGIACLVHVMLLVFAAGDYAYVVKHAPNACSSAVLARERAKERAKQRSDRAKALMAAAKRLVRKWWAARFTHQLTAKPPRDK